MSPRVRPYRLSPLALSDIEDIWLYTAANWSVEQADRYHGDIVATCEAISQGRKVGRVVDIRAGYFKYAVGAHVVFYRLAESSLDVIRVLHQKMDVGRHL